MPGAEAMPMSATNAAETGARQMPAAETGGAMSTEATETRAESGTESFESTGAETRKELPPEESLAETQNELAKNEEELRSLAEKIGAGDERFEELKKEFNVEGTQRSDAARETDRNEQLRRQREYLEKQEMLIVAIIAERRARIEKSLKEKIAAVFEEFDNLEEAELKNLGIAGLMLDGKPFDSKAFGELDPATAKFMVGLYLQGLEDIDMPEFIARLKTVDIAIYNKAASDAAKPQESRAQAPEATVNAANEGIAMPEIAVDRPTPTASPTAPSAPPAAA